MLTYLHHRHNLCIYLYKYNEKCISPKIIKYDEKMSLKRFFTSLFYLFSDNYAKNYFSSSDISFFCKFILHTRISVL